MGNVNVGQDITLHELRQFYSAVRSPKKHHWVSVVIAFVCRFERDAFAEYPQSCYMMMLQAADDASMKEVQCWAGDSGIWCREQQAAWCSW